MRGKCRVTESWSFTVTISGTKSPATRSMRILEVANHGFCIRTANSHLTLLETLSCHTDVALHDEEGNCFWLGAAGQRLDEDPNVGFDMC